MMVPATDLIRHKSFQQFFDLYHPGDIEHTLYGLTLGFALGITPIWTSNTFGCQSFRNRTFGRHWVLRWY